MFNVGRYHIDSRVVLAPMAGITDAPFRNICLNFGAGTATSEMVTANTALWNSRKSSFRLFDDSGRAGLKSTKGKGTGEKRTEKKQQKPRIIQIAGSEPEQLADAAKACADAGAQIVDINMGCPAKKVCKKAAGSALLRDEKQVENIISSVVKAVDIPVTLKIRTGWCPESRNGERIAHIAESEGIAALTVHGRTRACRFNGSAEYETIAKIVASVDIPVIANGDIDSPEKAQTVLDRTGAQAVMVGRGAQGRPWLFQTIDSYLKTPSHLQKESHQPKLELKLIADVICEHLQSIYRHYGDYLGLRIARKHLKWYFVELANHFNLAQINNNLQIINKIDSSHQQHTCVQQLFERLIDREDKVA